MAVGWLWGNVAIPQILTPALHSLPPTQADIVFSTDKDAGTQQDTLEQAEWDSKLNRLEARQEPQAEAKPRDTPSASSTAGFSKRRQVVEEDRWS